MNLITLAAIMCPSFTCEPPREPCCDRQIEQREGGLFAMPITPYPTFGDDQQVNPWRLDVPPVEPERPTEVVPEPSTFAIAAVLAVAAVVGRRR